MPILETQAWQEATTTSPKDEVLIITLEFQHPAFLEGGVLTAVRVARDNVETQNFTIESTANLNANQSVPFIGMPFEVAYPTVGEDLGVECEIRVDNVSKEISKYLEVAVTGNNPIVVIFRGYLKSQRTVVGQGPYRLELRAAVVKGATLSGKIMVSSPDDLKFLKKVYDQVNFPALLAIV